MAGSEQHSAIEQLEVLREAASVRLSPEALDRLWEVDKVMKWGFDGQPPSLAHDRYLLPGSLMARQSTARTVEGQAAAIEAVVQAVTPPVRGEPAVITTGRSLTFLTGSVVGVFPLAAAAQRQSETGIQLARDEALAVLYSSVANAYYFGQTEPHGSTGGNTYPVSLPQTAAYLDAAHYFVGMFDGLEPYASGAEACGERVGIPRDHMRIGFGVGAASVAMNYLQQQPNFEAVAADIATIPDMPPAPARPYDVLGLPGFSDSTSDLIIVGK